MEMIKKLIKVAVVLTGFVSLPSWGVAITGGVNNGTDVGSVDTYVDEISKADLSLLCGNPQGNPTCEESWVNSVLAPTSTSYTVKNETIAYFTTDVNGVYAFELDMSQGAPDYFLVKDSNNRALYQNLAELAWGVFSVEDFQLGGWNIPSSELTISHVTQFGAGKVPEPGVIALLAVGLVGVGIARRRTRV